MTDTSLINLGELSKPATVLVEKISEAVGGIFAPYQVVRVAKAEAEADKVRAESKIQVTDLHRRAMHRFLEEEAKKQRNIEDITERALPHLDEDSEPQNVKSDWITNFFDKCRIVSDEDMQKLWSGVLAGEAHAPGSFSRHTVNLLADLDKDDALLFIRLCGFCWQINTLAPLVYDVEAQIYTKHGIDFVSLSHLDSLGLIRFSQSTLLRTGFGKRAKVHYYRQPLLLTFPADTDNNLQLGHVMLTRAGEELALICGATPVDGFFDYVSEKWSHLLDTAAEQDIEAGG